MTQKIFDEEIEENAIKWLMRSQESMSKEEHTEFEKWLSNPKHKKAYEQVCETWNLLDKCKPAKTSVVNNHFYTRRSFLYTAATAVLALGIYGLYDYYKSTPIFSRTFISDARQTMEITLPDGTRTWLDANTKLEVVYYMQKRETKVHSGQVMFNVAANKKKVFYVHANNIKVTVVGTKFSVRNIDGGVKVAVQEGHVKVEDKFKTKVFNLLASDGIVVNEVNNEFTKIKVTPDLVGAWQKGRVAFENETLEKVLKEFARYGEKRLKSTSEVSNMRVTGSFDITYGGNFVKALPEVIPIKYVKDGKYLLIYKK